MSFGFEWGRHYSVARSTGLFTNETRIHGQTLVARLLVMSTREPVEDGPAYGHPAPVEQRISPNVCGHGCMSSGLGRWPRHSFGHRRLVT